MAKGMDGVTYFCVQFETSWRTSQRFTCIAVRLPPDHTHPVHESEVCFLHARPFASQETESTQTSSI